MPATVMWLLLAMTGMTATPQSPARGVAVAGVVQDQTGAILPGAQITLLVSGSAAPSQTAVSDAAGAFRFDRVPPGTYDIRTEFPGFNTNVAHVRVTTRAPGSTTVVMTIEGFTQEVSVGGAGTETSTNTAANLNAITLDEDTLDDLPVLDQDIVAAVSRFLDSSAIGTGGTTILVDGIEVNTLALSASAVQQIKINQDPYAAEFMRPGRGRIEIITKPGGKDYSGTFNLRFRDSAFYARNAFAATKPPEQRRIYEGTLGGPVPGAQKTNFLFSGSYDSEANQSIVFADTPAGAVNVNVATPYTHLLAAGTWNHQQGDNTTQSIRFSHLYNRNTSQGVGGVNLPEVGFNHEDTEDEATFSQQTIFSPTLLNDFKLLVGVENEPRTSLNAAPRIVVQDAFTGGGAQQDQLRTEHHFTLVEAITWSPANHTIKFGLNIPDWSWRGNEDNTNTGGTFYFSSLADYTAGRPYSFIQQAGDGHTLFLEKVVSGFVQDEIRLRPNFSVDVGLRYDWQNYFHDQDNFAPRGSFAYAVDENRRTILRGGAGVFYDRTGPGPIQDLLRYDGQHLQRYVLTDPGYPNPLKPGQSLSAQPVSLVQLSPDVVIPFTVQYSVGVERQLRPKTTLAINFIGSRGVDMFRSRDVNAPPPPLYLARPDPAYSVVRQIESAGTMRTSSLQFTLRGQMSRFFSGSAEYNFGRAYNDTSGIGWMPPNSYDLSLEYARADFNTRHRVDLFGTVTPAPGMNFGVSLGLYSGRPYSLSTGQDLFNTGTANARPAGVPRNSLEGPGTINLDLRWSREFVVSMQGTRKRTATIGVDAFNVQNRINYSTPIGNLSSPFFGQSISAQAPRRLQFSVRIRY
ncbi:MAG: carboxypeptidase regulatory-like domain-containing protein [Acidobacteriia bacterium]|nr:carboxypeptidase regulatory-like domain-containing protein [Terriglobia bacterium]